MFYKVAKMKKKITTILSVIFITAMLAACAGSKREVGTVAGGAGGAALGYAATDSIWGAAVGGGLGALAGGAVGESME